MATVFQRGEKWFAQWYRADGTRAKKATGTDKKREAQRIADQFEADDRAKEGKFGPDLLRIVNRAAEDMRKGSLSAQRAADYIDEIRQLADPNFKPVTIIEQIREWVRDQNGRVGTSTARGYRDMEKAVTKALGSRAKAPLAEFTHQEAGRLLHALKKGRTAATANMHFRAFRRSLQAALRGKLIADNPAQGVRPLLEDDSKERAPFSVEEVRKLLDAPTTSEEWKGAILIAAHTGLRLGDVVALGGSHVEGSTIVIRPSKTKRSRKTLTIPLSPPVFAWVQGKEGAFFPTLSAAKKGTLSTWFDRVRESAKVPKTIERHGVIFTRTFHSLRHSFTSWLADADIHPDVRQKLTGHSDAGIHALYSHHDKALADAIEKLPEV